MSDGELFSGLAALATPVMVAVVGFVLSRRLNRNTELVKLRVEYYKALAPQLNTLMCYMTFIGTWADHSPAEMVALKRKLDSTAYAALPLFEPEVAQAYNHFMDACFKPFGRWGRDALVLSGPYQRRLAWRRDDPPWSDAWDRMFTKADRDPITGVELQDLRARYDRVIAALVEDLKVTKARTQYTTDRVVMNAYASAREDIPGRTAEEPDGAAPGPAEVNPFHAMSEDPDVREG